MATGTELLFPLSPVDFALSNLKIVGAGSGSDPATNNPEIIKSTESYSLSVDVEIQPSSSPLVQFLMTLGLKVEATFAIEGFDTATEANLGPVSVATTAGVVNYTPTFIAAGGLAPGVYKAAAAVTIYNPAGTIPLGLGYIADIVFQVYS